MKLKFHWHCVYGGEDLYTTIKNKNLYTTGPRVSNINFKKLYIITNEETLSFMKLNKYKQYLKKL